MSSPTADTVSAALDLAGGLLGLGALLWTAYLVRARRVHLSDVVGHMKLFLTNAPDGTGDELVEEFERIGEGYQSLSDITLGKQMTELAILEHLRLGRPGALAALALVLTAASSAVDLLA